jgi:hypothetical protein
MRSLLISLVALLFALAPPLQAQILRVHFKDDKAEKKFKKYTSVLNGESVFIGEAVPGGGVLIEFKGGQLSGVTHKSNADNDFFVLDPSDPSKVPYKMENGEPVALKKTSIVTINGKYIDRLSVMMRSETIETIAREYRLRNGRVEELMAARDSYEKGSVEWFAQHNLMLGGYERLISWLESVSFTELAEKTEKDYLKEAKKVAEEATRMRAQRALDSVKMIGTPDELAKAAQASGADKYHFKIQESQHMRMVYLTERISDAQAAELLAFGEKVIEGFRNQFVDPYVSEAFTERVPDGLFQEFYFGPEEVAFHEQFCPAYFGISWGTPEQKARSFESTGNRKLRGTEPRLLDLWRLPQNEDLEGIVAHTLGHSLADYHFNGDPAGMEQAWIEEGLGYYLSFEFLGRNSVTCKEFRETIYVNDKGKEGYKEAQMGYRDILTAVALDEGERIDRVMLKRLVDMENPDLAKSWSFLEYLARQGGLTGQRWMRAACEAARNRGTFLEGLRKFSEEIFGVTGEDVFKVMDDRWRKYAEGERAKEY